jgi:hypothetical protein
MPAQHSPQNSPGTAQFSARLKHDLAAQSGFELIGRYSMQLRA